MKRFALILLIMIAVPMAAQDYEVPQISVSKDKVRVAGIAYYAHVVTAKQTLYSISKVYGVSIQDIYDSNKNLNLESEGLKIGQVLLIPTEPLVREEPVAEEAQIPGRALFPQMRKSEDAALQGEEDEQGLELINIAVLLPFNTGGAPDDKSIDFYSGALLAARELGNKGININLSTYDISGGNISSSMLRDADLILGPISEREVYSAASICPYGKYIISPLEPKTAGMVDTLRVIQVPTPTAAQAEDAVRWAISDMAPGDSLILIREKGKPLSGIPAVMLAALKASGMRYSTLSYDLLSGLQIQPVFVERSSAYGTTRYLIASDEESFINDAVRNINLMAYKKQDVVLYGPSRIRSFNTIETENLHNISTHVSSTYQIDYTRPEVAAFVMSYRALFGCEPNSFAFHGYDCLDYFATMCARFGNRWFGRLPSENGNGLQTDFSFEHTNGTGQINTAIRRVVYTPDFKITLQ
jgi:LysM repeat protein